MNYVAFLFFKTVVNLFRLIPFSVLYIISDILCFLLFKVFKYRVGTVKDNLKLAFPEKSDSEIHSLASKFYRHLSDLLMESFKGLYLSEREIVKRYKIRNPEVLDAIFKNGNHAVGMASHYGNWEWGPMSIGYQLKHRVLGYVKPLKNKYLFDFIRFDRKRPNIEVCSIYETQESLRKYSDSPTLHVFITDQSPTNLEKADWIHFLNQDTPWLHGADRIAREWGWPVVHMEIIRVKRGFYEVELELIEDDPKKTSEGDINFKYVKILEKQILRKPEEWLWSHRRWKRVKNKPKNKVVRYD